MLPDSWFLLSTNSLSAQLASALIKHADNVRLRLHDTHVTVARAPNVAGMVPDS
jgi:hypothetical protein